jgi:hypothetical protein
MSKLIVSRSVSISRCFVILCWVRYLYHNSVGKNIWCGSFWWFYWSFSSLLSQFSYFCGWFRLPLCGSDCFPYIHGVLGIYYSYTCHSFPIGWSLYSFGCSSTCWDWHFLVMDNTTRCSSHVTPSCLLSSPTLWELNGLVLSLVVGFFGRSPTRVGVCFAYNKFFFKYRVSMFPLMCKSRGKHLVISSSYHTCILWCAPKLLNRLKWEFEVKTSEK